MDAGVEQGFGGIDVADADDDGLIHDKGLHRRRAPARKPPQMIAIECPVQRFRPEPGEQVMCRARGLPEQTAEAARVGVAKEASGIQLPVVMVVLARFNVRIEHTQTAGHAEMQYGTASMSVHQQVFRAAFDRFDALTRQGANEDLRNRPAQLRLAYDQAGNDFAEQVRSDTQPRGFDFGQFRHVCNLSLRFCAGIAEQGVCLGFIEGIVQSRFAASRGQGIAFACQSVMDQRAVRENQFSRYGWRTPG